MDNCKKTFRVFVGLYVFFLAFSIGLNALAEHDENDNVVITGFHNRIDNPKYVEVAIFYNQAKNLSGFQLALVNFAEDIKTALQLAIFNTAENLEESLQLAIINSIDDDFINSWQVGLVNFFSRGNYLRDSLQLGGINVVRISHRGRHSEEELKGEWTDLFQMAIINYISIEPQTRTSYYRKAKEGQRCTSQLGLINVINIESGTCRGDDGKTVGMLIYNSECFDLYY